ncbi:carbohydrate ABC transporter permease [Kaistia geumhonensis]|uniref:Multiple sugar transport system permease protein n=1 Tax=Kaistia geumhonensis TaxID=410839 RepID=A0ABU0M9C1_9HYPH|nr:carbohydrate ABC transporter permease [Kaistia geumhonensis]MCX5480742.1 carbohydrate ABC transporter permease [Kaistia geumhonensis]MDQ0517554.1 multiple sugar transport system permease protein [Kaistia geumhonensis]
MPADLSLRALRGHALLALGYVAFAFFVLFPIVWIFLMSLKSFGDIIAYPPRFLFTPTLENYVEVLFGGEAERAAGEIPDLLRFLMNSVIISGGAVLVSIVLAVPAAYALARRRTGGARNIQFTFLSFRFAPELSIILPLYVIYTRTGLYDTYAGMILVHQLITLPLSVLILASFFRDIPHEIEEAARVDGANVLRILVSIVVPIARPGIASAMIIAFIFSWNNLIFGLVLAGGATRPVTMGILQSMTFDQIKWGLMAASAMVSALPGMVAAILFQRQITRGLTLGAVK